MPSDQVEIMCRDDKFRTLETCRGIARGIGARLEAIEAELRRLPGDYSGILSEPPKETVERIVRSLERDFA